MGAQCCQNIPKADNNSEKFETAWSTYLKKDKLQEGYQTGETQASVWDQLDSKRGWHMCAQSVDDLS